MTDQYLPLIISIQKPCFQDWEKMQRTENGKYCSSCQKEVIDLSGFTDKELYSFFSNRKTIPCGRFHSSQLNHSILPATPRLMAWPSLSKRAAAIFAFLSLKFSESAAQANIPTTIQTTPKTSASKAESQRFIIDGIIRDETGLPIPGAEIRLNEQVVAKSDSSGSFRFEVEAALLSKSIVLQFYSPGRVTVVRTYHPAIQSTSYNITLTEPYSHHSHTMGMPVFSTAFEPFTLTKPVEGLTGEVRAKLAETATAMRNHPASAMLLVGYGTTQKEVRDANRFLSAVKNYFIEREGIDETRIHTRVKSKESGAVNTIDVFSKKPNEELE